MISTLPFLSSSPTLLDSLAPFKLNAVFSVVRHYYSNQSFLSSYHPVSLPRHSQSFFFPLSISFPHVPPTLRHSFVRFPPLPIQLVELPLILLTEQRQRLQLQWYHFLSVRPAKTQGTTSLIAKAVQKSTLRHCWGTNSPCGRTSVNLKCNAKHLSYSCQSYYKESIWKTVV